MLQVKNQTKGGEHMALVLRSSAVESGGRIPQTYTCDGRDVSPPLRWDKTPQGTKSFALICDDPDAPMGTWVHWVIYNIPAETDRLPEAVPSAERLDNGALQGSNDFGRTGYGGPCPPRGKPHRYFFRLYALDGQLSGAAGLTKKALLNQMQGHILETSEFYGLYGRG
jgi:Raf kinase inhibitor-like YbhB/YbcL family protein